MTTCTVGRCPWGCGSHADPVANTLEDSQRRDDPRWALRNPVMCPSCQEVGGAEDWAAVCEACGRAGTAIVPCGEVSA